jgi:hypothetical protein
MPALLHATTCREIRNAYEVNKRKFNYVDFNVLQISSNRLESYLEQAQLQHRALKNAGTAAAQRERLPSFRAAVDAYRTQLAVLTRNLARGKKNIDATAFRKFAKPAAHYQTTALAFDAELAKATAAASSSAATAVTSATAPLNSERKGGGQKAAAGISYFEKQAATSAASASSGAEQTRMVMIQFNVTDFAVFVDAFDVDKQQRTAIGIEHTTVCQNSNAAHGITILYRFSASQHQKVLKYLTSKAWMMKLGTTGQFNLTWLNVFLSN